MKGGQPISSERVPHLGCHPGESHPRQPLDLGITCMKVSQLMVRKRPFDTGAGSPPGILDPSHVGQSLAPRNELVASEVAVA